MRTGIDILENELVEKYPQVLDSLLFDHTTGKNIIWATDNYEHLGDSYSYHSQILPELITGDYGSIIMPRVHKDKILQINRSKEMAEVFTPSWICNAQNNLIDNAWFERQGVFNSEIVLSNGIKSWEVNKEKIFFPKSKTWKDYIKDRRMEISCGEAPYITSRYDSTTGEFIPVNNRIGIVDRKLRVVNENNVTESEWFKAAIEAYKNTYAFEWQGDSLLIAREAMLTTFIENYKQQFDKEPLLKNIQTIADIISWNVWQMDGLKGVIPNSCSDTTEVIEDLFGNKTENTKGCNGCKTNNMLNHNGTYCIIMDWDEKDPITRSIGKRIRFVNLINKE
jgi:hypothetical protein